MTTNIYLVRHGEVHNPKKIVYGRLPGFRLSTKGVLEVEQTANFLIDKNISTIYSSPLLRARQTAKIIQKKLYLPNVFLTKDLLEVKSSAQGELSSKLDLIHHNYYAAPVWQKNDDTMHSIRDRMSKVFKRLANKHHGQSVAVVSHGDPILILKAYINNLPMELATIRKEKYELGHAEILKIEQIDNKLPTIKSVFCQKYETL